MESNKTLVPIDRIEGLIHVIRGHRIIIDEALASLYGVTTKRLNEQVKRNINRFPPDFVFKLTFKEVMHLRSQFATSSVHGGRRYLVYAFTEHGALMVANVMNSKKAVEMSVMVVRAFVRLRNLLITNKQFALKLEQLERKLLAHDTKFEEVFEAIRELMSPPPERPRKRIGFSKEEQ
jgi:phage regulator Rha-like protein